jgi:hypothetical protein
MYPIALSTIYLKIMKIMENNKLAVPNPPGSQDSCVLITAESFNTFLKACHRLYKDNHSQNRLEVT